VAVPSRSSLQVTSPPLEPEDEHEPIRILVADQAPVVVDGVRYRLHRARDFVLIGSAFNVRELLQLFVDTQPNMILLEHALPGGGVDPVLAHQQVRDSHCKIVVFSSIPHSRAARTVLQGGAHAYLLKTDPLDDLPGVLRAVHAGQHYVSPTLSTTVLSDLLDPSPDAVRLTRRQVEILRLIALGKTSPEIATELGIQLRTVHTHRARLMKKLEVHTATALVHKAQQKGLL
jgi:two-component system nitrate/nitrite response regulator NarL